MADEKKPEGNPYEMVWFVVGGLAILIALWWVQGGSERADLRGIFLSPPPPIGTGDAYGPEDTSSDTNQ